jgi:hypothetical protein
LASGVAVHAILINIEALCSVWMSEIGGRAKDEQMTFTAIEVLMVFVSFLL